MWNGLKTRSEIKAMTLEFLPSDGEHLKSRLNTPNDEMEKT